VNAYLEDLGRRFADEARKRGAAIEAPTLTKAVAEELLELTRIVAHSSERRFAPLSSYLAGLALARLRGALPDASDADLAGILRAVRTGLEGRRSD